MCNFYKSKIKFYLKWDKTVKKALILSQYLKEERGYANKYRQRF